MNHANAGRRGSTVCWHIGTVRLHVQRLHDAARLSFFVFANPANLCDSWAGPSRNMVETIRAGAVRRSRFVRQGKARLSIPPMLASRVLRPEGSEAHVLLEKHNILGNALF